MLMLTFNVSSEYQGCHPDDLTIQYNEVLGGHLNTKMLACQLRNYRKASNIRHTLVGNKIVDHSDVVGASPVGAAPATSSFST